MSQSKAPIIYKPTGTVQIANRFSLIERKLLNTVMYCAQQRRFALDEHELPITDVFTSIGLPTSRNHKVLKEALKTLIGTVIEWNVFGDDKVTEWRACTFLASGAIGRGKMSFRINPEIARHINDPKLFAKIQMLVQSQFKRRHALVLYEFFTDCICRQKANRLFLKDVSVQKLIQLMGLESSKYADENNLKIFNRDIIKPSLNDLNLHSDLQVTSTSVRHSRRIVAFDFAVERNTEYQVLLPIDDLDDPSIKITTAKAALSRDYRIKQPTELEGNLSTALEERGVAPKVAKRLIEHYSSEQISRNLQLIDCHKKEASRSTVKNFPAYLVRAITDDYAGGNRDILRSTPSVDTQSDLKLPARSLLSKGHKKFDIAIVRKKFDELSTLDQDKYRTTFLTSNLMGGTIRKAYEQHGGWDNPIVDNMFFEQFLPANLR